MNGYKSIEGKKARTLLCMLKSMKTIVSIYCMSASVCLYTIHLYVYAAGYAYSTWSIRWLLCVPHSQHTTICVNFAVCLIASISSIARLHISIGWGKKRDAKTKTTIRNWLRKKKRTHIYTPNHYDWESENGCSMTIIKLDGKSHRKIIELRILYYLHDDINTSDMICY